MSFIHKVSVDAFGKCFLRNVSSYIMLYANWKNGGHLLNFDYLKEKTLMQREKVNISNMHSVLLIKWCFNSCIVLLHHRFQWHYVVLYLMPPLSNTIHFCQHVWANGRTRYLYDMSNAGGTINTSAFEICKENVEFTYIIEELVIYNQSNFQNYVYNIQCINSF